MVTTILPADIKFRRMFGHIGMLETTINSEVRSQGLAFKDIIGRDMEGGRSFNHYGMKPTEVQKLYLGLEPLNSVK